MLLVLITNLPVSFDFCVGICVAVFWCGRRRKMMTKFATQNILNICSRQVRSSHVGSWRISIRISSCKYQFQFLSQTFNFVIKFSINFQSLTSQHFILKCKFLNGCMGSNWIKIFYLAWNIVRFQYIVILDWIFSQFFVIQYQNVIFTFL